MTTIARTRRDDFVPLWLCLSVAFIVALGIFFRVYNLDRKVFWEDEILGAIHTYGYTEAEIVAASPRLTNASDVQRYLEPNSSLGIRKTIGALAAEDPQHPPAYYVVTHLWTQRFGGSVEALRTPAAVFGVLVLPCVFWLALELFGSLASAFFAVALVALSPFFILYAQEAREYSMWTMAIALDSVVFLRASRSPAPAPWIAYGAVTAVSLYIYPLTGLVALGFAAYLLIRERGRLSRMMLACIVANLAALALFAPWIKAMITSTGVERGMAKILMSKLSPAQVARIFARDIRRVFFDIGQAHLGPVGHTVIDALFTLITVALCTYAIVALIRRSPYSVWGFVVIGLCLSMTPLVLRDLLVRGNFVYQGRYFLPLFLGTQLAVAALFGRLLFNRAAQGAARAVCAVLLLIIFSGEMISCAIASQATTWWNKDEERTPEVAALVNVAQRPLVISNYYAPSILELSLYLDPTIPMRLNLKCAQCASSRHVDVAFETAGYQTIFAVQPTGATSNARYYWVDPVPFPGRPNALNMFAVVLPTL
jgi:uncharacterized membrane protein